MKCELNQFGYCKECRCQQKTNVIKAFAAAKKNFGKPIASAFNAHYKNKYVPLPGWYDISKTALEQQDIEIKHECTIDSISRKTIFRTYLFHRPTNEYLEDMRYEIEDKPGPQAHGSCDTYFKRYALRSLFCIDVGEDDDDGNTSHFYYERVKKLQKLIESKQNAEKIMDHIKKKYGIHEIKNLGDGALFDAFYDVLTFKE